MYVLTLVRNNTHGKKSPNLLIPMTRYNASLTTICKLPF